MTQNDDLILETHSITRRYPGVLALDDVHLRVHRHAVNILIGENGAGKSTLMRILAGVERPDQGEVVLDGKPVSFHSPRDAAAHGIAIVHQELSVFPNLDLAENVFAGRELTHHAVIDRPTEDRQTQSALERLRKPMSAKAPASSLSLGSRQIVEIARTLAHGAKILILDEPTSALSLTEADTLFQVLEELKNNGLTIIYISHRLHELLHLGDRFTVLRGGRIVGEGCRGEVTRDWIVERMSGRRVFAEEHTAPPSHPTPLLQVRHLFLSRRTEDAASLTNLSFQLNRGEILGIYGLLGAGRTELLEVLAGATKMDHGDVLLEGKPLSLRAVAEATRQGIAMVPEDRQRDGLIPELSIRENMALSSMHGLFIHRKVQAADTMRLAAELHLAADDLERPITTLSGGNQQKALLARCLMRSPKVLLLDEPTRGVDVGAKQEIYGILQKLAARGLGILFTSSEIEETRCLAHRAIVLCQGRVAATFTREQLTDEALFAAASPHIASSTATSSSAEVHP